MRFTAIQMNDDEYELIWTHHHLYMDGWAASNLIIELKILYENNFNLQS